MSYRQLPPVTLQVRHFSFQNICCVVILIERWTNALQAVAALCRHYEHKAAGTPTCTAVWIILAGNNVPTSPGKYSNAALCGRFLLELSREVQSMVNHRAHAIAAAITLRNTPPRSSVLYPPSPPESTAYKPTPCHLQFLPAFAVTCARFVYSQHAEFSAPVFFITEIYL